MHDSGRHHHHYDAFYFEHVHSTDDDYYHPAVIIHDHAGEHDDDNHACNLDDCPYRIHDDHPAPQHVNNGTGFEHIDDGPNGLD